MRFSVEIRDTEVAKLLHRLQEITGAEAWRRRIEWIQRYLSALETADRTQPPELEAKTTRLQEKIGQLRDQMHRLEQIKEELKTQPDGQLSLTDPDARSMATSGRGSGMVGYNVQVAVDTRHHRGIPPCPV